MPAGERVPSGTMDRLRPAGRQDRAAGDAASCPSGISGIVLVGDFGAKSQRALGVRPFPSKLGDLARYRHAEAGHDVHDLASDLGLPCGWSPRVEAATDQLFLLCKSIHTRIRGFRAINRL